MRQRTPLRIWALVGVVAIAVIGVALLLSSLQRGPGDPAPTSPPKTERQSPTAQEPVAATVNDARISYSTWTEAFVIDQVMSGIAGQPAPSAEETLQRLINEELLLQGMPSGRTLDTSDTDAHIAVLEASWGVEDAAVTAALERVGLNRAALERSVGRLLLVQASLEALEDQAQDPGQWLEAQRAAARIEVTEGLATPSIPVALLPTTAPQVTPALAPSETPIPPTATAELAAQPPQIAPDFTLPGARGITVTLSDQLAEGPVVLVFFQRGGG